MGGDVARGLFVEAVDRCAVGLVAARDFRGHGIEQRQFDHIRTHVLRHDPARIAVVSLLGEMRHDIGLGERPHGLERHQFGVAGARSHADQPPGQSPALASALTAAAVIAEPPSRPRTTAQGTA